MLAKGSQVRHALADAVPCRALGGERKACPPRPGRYAAWLAKRGLSFDGARSAMARSALGLNLRRGERKALARTQRAGHTKEQRGSAARRPLAGWVRRDVDAEGRARPPQPHPSDPEPLQGDCESGHWYWCRHAGGRIDGFAPWATKLILSTLPSRFGMALRAKAQPRHPRKACLGPVALRARVPRLIPAVYQAPEGEPTRAVGPAALRAGSLRTIDIPQGCAGHPVET